MAKKKTYYDPQNGQHYYHGESIGASNWGAPESVKDESYINQYNYTPSYNAYRQYLEEERRRREEEERRRMAHAVDRTPNGPTSPENQILTAEEMNNRHIIDLRDANASRTERAVDRIKAEVDSQTGIFGKKRDAQNKLKELGNQADDILVENYIPQSVKANDQNTINDLDKKIKDRGTLTPDEEVQYSDAKLRQYYKKFPGLEKLMTERNDYHSAYSDLLYGQNSGGNDPYVMKAMAKVSEAEGKIKKLTGWSDDEMKTAMQYADRSRDRQDALASAKQYEIDTNASVWDQRDKAIKNTVSSLANNRGIQNFNAWMDNRFADHPNGFGANIDSSAYRPISNASAALGETSKAIKDDATKIVSAALGKKSGEVLGDLAGRTYESGVSAVDSELTKIPGVILGAATGSKQLGEAVGLAPYFFKSYNSDYMAARQKGATEQEARQQGTMSGLIEVATELVGVDNFIDNTIGKNAGKSFVKNLIKQMTSEGLEEALSDVLNEFVDAALYAGDDEVKTSWQQRVEDTGSVGGAFLDFLKDAGLDFVFGALSAGPGSAGSMGTGAYRYGNMTSNISQNAQRASENITGDSDYEKSVKAQMDQYAKNPTRYIADNLAENTKEDKERKAEAMKIAQKEANGESLTAGERLFIEEAIAKSEESNKKQAKIDKKEGKTQESEDNSNIPLEYRNKVSNVTEDEARVLLAQAAKSGDTNAFIDAIQMTRNSSNKEVAENAEQIIGDYSGMAQSHGITAEEIGRARLTRLEAYKAGLSGENLSNLSEANQEAYNAGKMEALNEKSRTTIEGDAIKNTEVTTKEGKTVKLTGAFTEDGIQTDNGAVKLENIDLPQNSAAARAYQYADRYDNVNVKNAFISGIKDGQNIEQYKQAFDKMYDSAMAGVSYENAKKSIVSQFADEDVLKAAYTTGQTEAGARSYASLADALGDVKAGKGKVINESSSASADMIDFYDKLARRTGLTFKIVDEMNQEGARGSFQVSKSTITVRADKADVVFHELGEFTEAYNKKEYDALRNAIANFSSEKMGNDKYMRMMRAYKTAYAQAGEDTSADEMSGEMFNDTISIMMRSDKGRDALAKFLAQNYGEEEARTIGQQAADYMRKLAGAIKKAFGVGKKGGYEGEMAKYADELGEYADQFVKALDGAIENYKKVAGSAEEQRINAVTETVGIHYDATDEMAYPSDYSLETWTESEYKKNQKEAAKELSKALGITQKKALDYINDIDSIAKIIADDRVRLDYDSDEGSAVVSNSDYGASIDFSTICKKRLLYTGTLQQIQKQIGNRVITVDDYLDIRQAMLRDNLETTCGCCYVEGSRAKLGGFMKEFIRKYAAKNPEYVPTMYDVSTPDGIRQLRANHPEAYKARDYFLNHYGKIDANDTETLFASQQKPKDYTERKAYKGEIIKMFKGKKDKVADKNLNGGLRLQSFSDFEVVNLLDLMQVITDMSRVGLAGQAYTKVKNFADAVGNTGLKINLSLMAKGVDKNGNLILDEINGMKKADAEYLRNKYSKNVGTIIVCFTDEQIKAAMKDNMIDFIIPFHRSQWQKSQYEALGLPKGTKDYTNYQEDGVIGENGRRRRADHSYMSKEYWDFSKSGRENAETYIKMCNDNNKVPVFDFLLEKDSKGKYYLPEGADGYFKLLIDFKMYDNDGVGSPQMPVRPDFSLDECRQMLMDYEGGHETFPVDQKIADEFTKKIKKREKEFKYSLDVNSEGDKLTKGQAEYFKDSQIRDENGNLKVMYHGTQNEFYVFDPKKLGGKNGTAEGFGIYFTDDPEVSQAYGNEQMKGYVNVTNPARYDAKTIKANDLQRLIKATAEAQAKEMVDEEGYDSLEDALKDSWVSNIEYTYDKPIAQVYRIVAEKILKMNHNDMDIIQEIMSDQGIRDYEDAYKFYDILQDTLGIDGYITEWEDSKTGEKSEVVVAFNSNQFKNIANENPTDSEDIRYSLDVTVDNIIDAIDDNLLDLSIDDLEDDIEDLTPYEKSIITEGRKLIDELKAVSDAPQKEKRPRARHLLRSMLGSEFDSTDGKKIAFTDDRIDKLLKMFAASNKDYAQAYLTYMSPADYLLLTTNGNDGTRSLNRIKADSTPLDIDELKDVYDTQPIFLDLAEKGVGRGTKNEIIGHEGRHRMYALQLAGFNQIPVLVFNYDNKYNKKAIDSIDVYPQSFDEDVKYNKSNLITLNNLQPLSRGNEDNIRQMFGEGQQADLRLSLTVDSEGNNLSDDQKEYFKDSKAVDDQGRLLVMYHGTENEFTVFEPSEFTEEINGLSQIRGYFSTNREYSENYGDIVNTFYLNVTNPLDFRDLQFTDKLLTLDVYKEWFEEHGVKDVIFDSGIEESGLKGYVAEDGTRGYVPYEVIDGDDYWRGNGNVTEQIRKAGYDAVIWSEGYTDDDVAIMPFDANAIKRTDNLKPTKNEDVRYSLEVDSKGRDLAEGQQKYFNDSKVVDENGALKVMYHGARGAGFTVFDNEYSDDNRSFFFSDDPDVAKSYMEYGADQFPLDKPMEFDELDDFIASLTGGDMYLENDGDDVVIMEYDPMQDGDTEVYRGNLKGAQTYIVDWYSGQYPRDDGYYEVYLKLENPYIYDAKGAWWNDLFGGNDIFAYHMGDVQITKTESGYEVDWMENMEFEHETFKTFEDLEAKFGEIFEPFQDGEVYIEDIYLDKDRRRIPTTTRMVASMAESLGHDGVIFKNIVDVGGNAPTNKVVSSTVAVAFKPDQIKSVYNANPTSSEDIRYALDLAEEEGGWVDFDDILGFDSSTKVTEEQAVNILEKGMEALKNKEVDVPKLRTLALKLRNEFGSSYNVNTFTENLRKAFAYMQTEDHVDYRTMMGILKDIARPVIDESNEKIGEQEYKDFLNYFKGKKIKLTSKQKEEVKYTCGSYGAFRNAMMPITISDNAETTLDQIWDELVEQSGYVLDRDAVEGDMPLNLLDALHAMRPTVRNAYGEDSEDAAKDLAMRIVEEYIEGEFAKEMRKEVNEYRNKLKKDYQERLKDLKGKVNAEVRARNKRRAEDKKEREDVNKLKHDIKINANKLITWIQKPTEGKSVPHDMVVPVVQFLQAIDFVDPVITQREDGKWQTKVFDHLDYDNGNKKFVYKDIVGDSREDVLRQFNEAIGRGEGSKEQRSWTEKMQGVREMYDKVLKDDAFEDTSMDFLMQGLDAQGLTEELNDLLARNKGEVNMNHLGSKDLDIIDKVIKNMFHAINQGNKAYSSPSVDIVNLAQSTIQDAEGKEIKSRNKILESLHKMFRLDNVTPRTFFKLLGKRGIDVYKFMRDGLNQEITDLKKASEFMTGAMDGIDRKDALKWTGRNAVIHEFTLSSGTHRMTDGQIMGLYCTIRRNGAKDRIKGGIKADTIYTKGRPIEQSAIHLTDSDIAKIEAALTPEQIDLAKKMQQYMAVECSKQGNETSRKLYGYEKFTDPTYYPWTVDKDTVATSNTSENIPMFTGIERSGFTKQLKEGATNPLVIRDIFDVFTDHVAQMAAYHGYAGAVKDTLRWMNYREQERKDGFVNWITTKNAINTLSNSRQGVGYIRNLLLDINKANKSQYIGNFTDKLIGNYKAAAVGANLRVVAQQPTAYFRALNQIDPKYLLAVNPSTAVKNIKKSQEESPISWWKSKGYYETNLGQPIKEIVTGIASPVERAKDIMMSPAGWADDFTWGFLYTAVEKEQRDKYRGQNISAEEFRKAVNDRFDEVVDNTQVVDSTLHRSQYMRSTDRLNKLQTAFMAEPTKSYNMLLESAIEDLNEGKTMKRTSRAVTAFVLSALATSAAAAVVDAMRKTRDDEDWWKVWLENLKQNMADNVNPFNLLPVVKDVSAGIFNLLTGQSTFGQSGNRFDIEAISTIVNAIQALSKMIEGESTKTGYGNFMTIVAKPFSQVTGIPAYNAFKDLVALYNTFFKNIETTVNSESAGRNERKKGFVKDVDRERSENMLDEGIKDAIEHGVSIYDLKGAIQSEYKNKYFDLYNDGQEEEAKELADRAARAYARMGLSDEEIDEIINAWQDEVVTFAELDRLIASGQSPSAEVMRLKEYKDDEKILKHLIDRYSETIAYEDTHNTNSTWRQSVERAIVAVDPTLDFDEAHEESLAKKKEQEEKAAKSEKNSAMKSDFYDAVEKKDGSAGRKALEQMKSEGVEAKSIKASISTRYHEIWKAASSQAEKDKAKSDWKSAYTLVNNVYNVKSDDLDKTWAEWEKKQD